MKLLSEDLLKEYGFTEKPHVANRVIIKVMTRDNIDLVIKDDGIYYSNMGFDYPLMDSVALRKLYKGNKNMDLKLSNPDIVTE